MPRNLSPDLAGCWSQVLLEDGSEIHAPIELVTSPSIEINNGREMNDKRINRGK